MELLRIKELLKEKNMTGKDLAEKVNVSTVAISNIASGNSFPKPELLKNIAEAMDVDIRELFVPTKQDNNNTSEPFFIEREGKYIRIGEIDLKEINGN